MSVQSTIYDLETTDIRFFLSTKPIASKSHVAIWIKGDDDIYRITNENEYELINDNIVFPTHPSGKALEVRVGDTPSDLVQAPNDIAIVSSIAGEVVIVADSVQDVITVSDNISSVTIVSDNMTELLVISADIDLVILSKEYAVNPEDVAITDNPTDYSSLHHASKSKASAEEAQAIVDSINFPAGLIMQWDSDNKPSGWLWCDGASYSVFSPNPALAYDELYQFRVDPTYVMTTKPTDWDTNYPDDPNGWYDPSFEGSVVTQTELDLLVTVPDRRGVFVRGKDRAGSVGATRGLDSHGVVPFDAVTPSQNKAHSHDSSFTYSLDGYEKAGADDRWTQFDGGNTKSFSTQSDGEAEGHGTYTSTNYIIRAKGSYSGDGTGSGGTGIVPVASEIDYSDTYSSGDTNLQDTTDNLIFSQAIKRIDVGAKEAEDETIWTGEIGFGNITDFRVLNENWAILSENDGLFKMNLTTGVSTLVLEKSATVVVGYSHFAINYESKLIYALAHLATGTYQHLTKMSFDDDGNIGIISRVDVKGDIPSTCVGLACSSLNEDEVYATDESSTSYNMTVLSASLGTVLRTVPIGHRRGGVAEHTSGLVLVVTNKDTCRLYDPVANEFIAFDAVTSFVTPFPFTEANHDTAEYRFNHDLDSNGDITLWTAEGWRTLTIDTESYTWSVSDVLTEFTGKTAGGSAEHNAEYLPNRVKLAVSAFYVTTTSSSVVKRVVDPDLRAYAYHGADYPIALPTKEGALSFQNGSGGAKVKYSTTFGYATETTLEGGLAVGAYNSVLTAMFVVGIGDSVTPADGLLVYPDGDVQAPSRLASPNATSLLTKDVGDGLYHPKETGFTGSFLIANGDTVTVVNGIITTVAP